MKRSLRFGAVCTLFGAAVLSQATDNLDWDVIDTIGQYKATFLHDGIFFSHTHLIDHVESGVFWKVWGPFVCDTGFLSDDTMAWAVANQHRIAPHQEAPGVIVTWADVEVPQEDAPYTYRTAPAEVSVQRHGEHYDIFDSQGLYKLSHFAGIDKIEGFADIMVGDHNDSPNAIIRFDQQSIMDFLNGSSDPSYSVGYLAVNPSTGALDARFAIHDQPIGSLVQVTLNLGGPGQNGPVILDLGGSAQWTSRLNGTSVTRSFNGQFPQQYMGALLNGQVYFHVTNAQNLLGSIRGQVNRTPYGVRPDSVAVVKGTRLSGAVAEVEGSDNSRLVVQKNVVMFGSNSEPVQMTFAGWSWAQNPQVLRFQMETSASVQNALQRTSLFNFTTNQYELVDQRPATQLDSKIEVSVNNQASRFVKSDGTVLAKLTFQQMGQPFNKLWTASVDKIHWQLVQ